MSDGGVRVRASTEVAALTRANIIGHIAREVTAVFKPADTVLETVLRGFREGYLEELELLLRDDAGETVGYLSIKVDWETYSVAVRDGTEKKTYRLDPSQPVTGQVAPTLAKAVAYLSAKAEELGVASCRPLYTYRAGRRDEGRKVLRTSPISDEENVELGKVREEVKMVVTDSALKELTVSFGQRRRET